MSSIRQFDQKKYEEKKFFDAQGNECSIKVKLRYDDDCKNGYNTFSITATIYDSSNIWVKAGCFHDEIAHHFPHLAKYIKWHLCSSNEPLHYLANTMYWIQQDNIANARKAAIWENATEQQLSNETLLRKRLPQLLQEFKTAMESLGFIY